MRNAANIALKVAAGVKLDYITVTFGRRAGIAMRYWPWLALEAGDEPANHDWPVLNQKVVVETVCESVSEEEIQNLVGCLQRDGASTIIVLRKHSTTATVIDGAKAKDIQLAKALAILMKKRQDFYKQYADEEEKRLMLELSHEGMQDLAKLAAQYEEAA